MEITTQIRRKVFKVAEKMGSPYGDLFMDSQWAWTVYTLVGVPHGSTMNPLLRGVQRYLLTLSSPMHVQLMIHLSSGLSQHLRWSPLGGQSVGSALAFLHNQVYALYRETWHLLYLMTLKIQNFGWDRAVIRIDQDRTVTYHRCYSAGHKESGHCKWPFNGIAISCKNRRVYFNGGSF